MSDRKCRKCGEHIPYNIKINGKQVSLQNRKFCLNCSSYNGRNTSPKDPIVRKARKWKNYSSEQKERVKISLYRRALERRTYLIEKSGGKCIQCGYCKCFRALSYHHRNPEEKEFGLTLNNLWSKQIEDIENEWRKCDLLCFNCYAELEDEKSKETSIVKKINEKYGTNY
jgi:hypothetical protein